MHKKKKNQHLAASLICACLTSFFAGAVRISQLCRKRETETEVCHQWPHCQKQISATALYKIFTELQCTWLLGWWPQSRSRYSQHLLKYDLKFSFIHKYKIITYDTQIVQAGQAEATECGESLYKGKKCHVLIWLFNLFSILAAGSNPGSWTCPLLHPISKALVFQ